MFYSDTLLSKTGPLAKIWLASHVERKLTKQQILQQDVSSSVSVIVDQGTAPIALRTSGQLMLGVVRIYGRQAKYLLEEVCPNVLEGTGAVATRVRIWETDEAFAEASRDS